MTPERIGVVGAGIVGLAVARRLGEVLVDARVTVLDKESSVGAHQSSHNSGVVHAGLYYAPGSLKATLCRRGGALLREYCSERGIAFEESGKLVVAVDESEVAALDRIQERATTNSVPGLVRLGPEGIRSIEPHTVGVAGLHSPHTAITDYPAITRAYAKDVLDHGGDLILGEEVTSIETSSRGAEVQVGAQRLVFDRLILCAGLQSDRVAVKAGDDAEPAIVPFRGEYYRIIPERSNLVRGLIYPVPDPDYPFLGIHFTRRVDGQVDVGPNAVLALAREGYSKRDVSVTDVWENLRWPGFRRLAMAHWRMGVTEMVGSLSKSQYLRRAQAYVPELQAEDVVRAPAGVRAQAVDRSGALVDDFRIHQMGPVLAVRNAPSPAATSSLAIAEYVCDRMLRGDR